MNVAELGPSLRAELTAIVLTRFEGATPADVYEHVIRREGDSRLRVFFDEDGRAVGFTVAVVSEQVVDDHAYAILDIAAYFEPGVRGGLRAAIFGALDTLALRIRHPKRTFCFIGQASTPVMYRLVHAGGMIGTHPRPGVEPPREVEALIRQVMAARGYDHVEDDTWRVRLRFPVRLRDEPRMRRFVANHGNDEAVAYYVERNPGFLDGEWLVIYAPLRFGAILRSLGKLVAKQLRHA